MTRASAGDAAIAALRSEAAAAASPRAPLPPAARR